MFRNRHVDRVSVAELEADEFLTFELGLDLVARRTGLDRGSVADADEAEDAGVAFGDAEDVGVETGPGRSWGERRWWSVLRAEMISNDEGLTPHRPLVLFIRVFHPHRRLELVRTGNLEVFDPGEFRDRKLK